jgi:hypothetical protein
MTVSQRDDRERLNLWRLCEELGGDFAVASGERRSGPYDVYRLQSSTTYRSGSLDAIALRAFGRFGNNLRQILHATFFAEAIGVERIHVQQVNVGRLSRAKTVGDITFVPERPGPASGAVLVGSFFHTDAFRATFLELNARRRWGIVCRYLRPMLFGRWTCVAPDDDVLHIHLRGGDVFGSRVHRGYAQPPLAYYKAVLAHFCRLRRSPRFVVVFEDRRNPCVEPFCALLAHEGMDFALHRGDFESTVGELLTATNLVVGTGTFGAMIGLVSSNTKRIYGFRDLIERATFHEKGADVLIARDIGGGYIGRDEWRNSKEQRALMLDYPHGHVEIVASRPAGAPNGAPLGLAERGAD